ncbi:MAG TPA: hypothetical protein VHC22_20005 [Pirellulales bacterium]|nr:hypothetical protein [Pirellulales bacterium]
MIIYNDNVIFAALIGAVCGGGVYSLFRNGGGAALAGCSGMMAFDLVMRIRNQTEDARLIAPDAGGHIWFIPVWTWALVGGLIGGSMWMGWL